MITLRQEEYLHVHYIYISILIYIIYFMYFIIIIIMNLITCFIDKNIRRLLRPLFSFRFWDVK